MALAGAEEPAVRALGWLRSLALYARRPARRLCGTVRVAVVYVAALLGAFLLTEGSMCFRKYWGPQLHELVITTAVLAFMGAIGDVLVLASILGWGRFAAGGKLSRLLCGRLALASAHLPLAPIWVIWALVKSAESASWLEIAAWETVRFVGTLLLAVLLYCLLSELHPEEEPMVSWVSTRGPIAEPTRTPVALADPASYSPATTSPVSTTPAPTTLPSTTLAVPAEEPTPGPAPPPRRHN